MTKRRLVKVNGAQWEVVFTKYAARQFKRVNKPYSTTILLKIKELAALDDPRSHQQVKALKGLDSVYRLRVGDYRIILEVTFNSTARQIVIGGCKGQIDVTDIDSRGDIYQR
jgi:mRNA-degrading endonuclease RelE of RelBE toxin-antitoxin system